MPVPTTPTFLLYHPLTRPTGRALAAAMGVPGGTRLPGYLARSRGDLAVIRWGSRRPIPAGVPVFNRAEAIARASDKRAAFDLLAAAGVPIPAYGNVDDAAEWLADGDMVLGRTRRESRGRGIVIYRPGDTLADGHEIYTRLVPDVRDEYRLHVVAGEVIRTQRKRGPGEALIRSHAAGYRYVGLVSRRLNRDRLDAATRAVEALGLDFGAVDLIVGRDGDATVLEVNTAPSCSPLTLDGYSRALRELGT